MRVERGKLEHMPNLLVLAGHPLLNKIRGIQPRTPRHVQESVIQSSGGGRLSPHNVREKNTK